MKAKTKQTNKTRKTLTVRADLHEDFKTAVEKTGMKLQAATDKLIEGHLKGAV